MRILVLFFALCLTCVAQQKPVVKGLADYRIQPEDTIVISVVGEPTLTEVPRKVTSSGTITYPYLKEIKVVNKTPAEVEEMIRTRLDQDYIIDPQVIVQIKEYRSRNVTVLGEVMKPGVYPLAVEQRTDLLQVIAVAGGLSKLASKSKIELTREGKTQRFSYEELKRTEDPEKKIWILPNDVISIGESTF